MIYLEEKKLVVEMGKKLLHSNLTIRTWGNISTRVDDDHFAISPSGCFYESLRPEEVVVLNVDTPDKYGNIKPSSERHIHSQIYKLDKSIKFIIHTHQKFASAIAGCSPKIFITDDEARKILGEFVPVIKYAPAGTKKLANNISACLKDNMTSIVLIPNHGVVCFGDTLESAFLKAEVLENFAKQFILNKNYNLAFHFYQYEKKTLLPLFDFHSSKRVGDDCFIYDVKTGVIISKMNIESGNIVEGEFNFTYDLHRKIYATKPEINFIEQSMMPASFFLSKKLKAQQEIPAFLEDFAQIAGDKIFAASFFENRAEDLSDEICRLLKNKNAISIIDSGFLCCENQYSDIQPLKEIIEKNSLAILLSWKYPEYSLLSQKVAKKMRKGYLLDRHY